MRIRLGDWVKDRVTGRIGVFAEGLGDGLAKVDIPHQRGFWVIAVCRLVPPTAEEIERLGLPSGRVP
ncbi:hypothetical protein [Streptomyces caatingaensis]|uniref:hypothetical protein n=1 Tax=Streptomyces caatingaensis TaxID=1678637 RepID=UPI000A63FA93|nr:hypothetical protein [Streptomyces caatingaensis]